MILQSAHHCPLYPHWVLNEFSMLWIFFFFFPFNKNIRIENFAKRIGLYLVLKIKFSLYFFFSHFSYTMIYKISYTKSISMHLSMHKKIKWINFISYHRRNILANKIEQLHHFEKNIYFFTHVFSIYIFNKSKEKERKKTNWRKVNVSRGLAFNEIPGIKKFNLFPSAKFSGKVKGRPRVKELHIVVSVHETVTVISSL